MVTREDHANIVKAIDLFLAETGEVKNKVCVTKVTAKDILLRAGCANTEVNWNYIIHTVKTLYPQSRWERGSQDEGWLITVRTRVR